MAVRMLRTVRASPDGLHVYEYEEGREYAGNSRPPLSPELERLFIEQGWAVDVEAKAESGPGEDKALPGPAHDKALPGSSENKTSAKGKGKAGTRARR